MTGRRDFLAAAALGLVAILDPAKARAIISNDAVYTAAFKDLMGNFGVGVLSQRGELLHQYPLPARGHDVVISHSAKTIVVIARRPGTFAMAIDLGNANKPIIFATPENRHFYGHGVFSSDNRLIFTTENDFENARGMIGIYDVNSEFARVGEFPSFGIGPHDMALLHDGRTLCVANGGIETHPDLGRTKLNLHQMEPSIAFIDIASGDLIEKHTLPSNLSQVSTRHLDVDERDGVWVGCQYQGQLHDEIPLIAKVSLGEPIQIPEIAPDQLQLFKNYIGSVVCNQDNNTVAFSSPRGGVVVTINTLNHDVIDVLNQKQVCGLAASRSGFIASSATGIFAEKHHNLFWDNHIGAGIDIS